MSLRGYRNIDCNRVPPIVHDKRNKIRARN